MSDDELIDNYNFAGAFLKGRQKFQEMKNPLKLDNSLDFDDTLKLDDSNKLDSDHEDEATVSNIEETLQKFSSGEEIIDTLNIKESLQKVCSSEEVIDISNIGDTQHPKNSNYLANVVPQPNIQGRVTRAKAKSISEIAPVPMPPTRKAKSRKKRKSPNSNATNDKSKRTRGRKNNQNIIAVINLDCDDEPPPPVTNVALLLSSGEDSDVQVVRSDDDEEVNYEQRVLVKWNCGEIHRLSLRKFQKFSFIQEHFAKLEQCSKENICIKLNDKYISPSDSIDSVNLTVKDILDAFVNVKPILNNINKNDSNKLNFKVQQKDSKRPITVAINSTDKMKVLMEKVREELSKPLSALFFEFDGEKLDGNLTAEEQDMYGGECIDLRIKE